MHPILIDFGFLTIGTYGFFLAIAFVAAITLAVFNARKSGIPPSNIIDFSCYILISAILGSKLLLVIVDWRDYMQEPGRLLGLFRLGGVFYGGLILAILTGLWYVRRKGLSTWQMADVVAPSIALGQAVGRIGCLMAGCCFGRPCALPWAVTFTEHTAHENVGVPLHVALHPTQLYSSINALFIFVLLMLLSRKKRFEGQIFWIYIGLYAVTRTMIEFFRGDHRGSLFGTLSTSQSLSLVLFVCAGTAYTVLRRRARGH